MASKQKLTQQSGSRRCDICGCNVSGGPKAWIIHTEGIRHRRNAASCKICGEPGHHVVSTFEHHEGPPPARYRGKDTVLLSSSLSAPAAAASNLPCSAAAATAGAAASHESQRQLLQQVQVQLRKHLANQVGINSIYHKAVERFTLDALGAAWKFVEESIKQQIQTTSNPLLPANHHQVQQIQQQNPDDRQQHSPNPTQHNRHQPQQQVCQTSTAVEPTAAELHHASTCKLQLFLQEPSQVACLAEVLPDEVGSLEFSVPYQTYGPAAAATSAAVASFLSSLSHRHHLQQLHLMFHCDDFSRILRQGGGGLARLPELWGKVADVLTKAMKVNCGLRKLVIASYPGQFPPDELAALQVTLATARQHLRAAVLLGTHSRVGSSSLLHQLPHEVMVMLVERAVPQACVLWLTLPQGLDGADSSSSSDEDEYDDDEEDSSDEEEEEDDTSSSSSSSSDDNSSDS